MVYATIESFEGFLSSPITHLYGFDYKRSLSTLLAAWRHQANPTTAC